MVLVCQSHPSWIAHPPANNGKSTQDLFKWPVEYYNAPSTSPPNTETEAVP